MSRTGRRARIAAEGVAVAALYMVAAALVTWPAIAHLDQVIIGGGELGGWLWRQWWHSLEFEALVVSDLALIDRLVALVGLGRYPETGNILDVMLLAWPLQSVFGLTAGYNLQVLLTLSINGLCGYALARSLAGDRVVALAAGLVAVINPVCFQDIEASGLRQVLLWWVLLLPIPLRRAIEHRSAPAAAASGLLLGLSAAFYWFYGLFAGMLVVIWVAVHLWQHRAQAVQTLKGLRWLGDLALFTALVAVPFATPYVLDEGEGRGVGRTSELPELTWAQDFPDLDTLLEVPLRPSTPEENLLSSLQRGLMSSWSPDWIVNPGHGRSMPVAVFWLGVLPLLVVPRWRTPVALAWLAVFIVFYLGTLGPFLKPPGGQVDTAEVVRVGGEAVRLPWTWMFKWIPGMARMFGPYRMGSLLVVASVGLLALGLARLPGGSWPRRVAALAVIAATLLQAQWRWDIEDPVQEAQAPSAFLTPLGVSAFRVPTFYEALAADPDTGIIELPLGQQQDLICLYQLHHGRKVYGSWATEGAVPPLLRERGGGPAGAQLRHLAARDGYAPSVDEALSTLSRDPAEADLSLFGDQELGLTLAAGGYHHVVLHERGYFLVDPERGAELYQTAVGQLAARLGVQPEEQVDLAWFDFPGNRSQASQPARATWTASRIALHDDALPSEFRMAVFDVTARAEAYDGPIPELGPPPPTSEEPTQPSLGESPDIVLVVVPGLGADGSEPGLEAAFLDGLNRTPSVRFSQVHAQSTSPYLGLGSLLTSAYPSALPLCSLQGGDPRMGDNAPTTWCTALPRTVVTLPQALATHGYKTGATVAEADPARDTDRWTVVINDVQGWWDQVPDQPRFAMVVVPDLAVVEPGPGLTVASLTAGIGADVDGLLTALEEDATRGAPWILITSTTALAAPAEPGWLALDRLRVPVLIFDPAAEGPTVEVDRIAAVTDVMPTILARAGAKPQEGLQGTDLLTPEGPPTDRTVYSAAGDALALRAGRWLLTFRGGLPDSMSLDPLVTDRLLNHTADDGAFFRLHDVVADPDQRQDLLQADPATAAALREALVVIRTEQASLQGDLATPERLEALRARNGGGTW